MIRGLNKQVIVVRDTGSDYFEEAIFIVNPSVQANDADLAAEAHRLIAASSSNRPAPLFRTRFLLRILLLFAASACLLGIGYLLALLF